MYLYNPETEEFFSVRRKFTVNNSLLHLSCIFSIVLSIATMLSGIKKIYPEPEAANFA